MGTPENFGNATPGSFEEEFAQYIQAATGFSLEEATEVASGAGYSGVIIEDTEMIMPIHQPAAPITKVIAKAYEYDIKKKEE